VREEGGVVDDEGVSAGVGGELDAGLASALEAEFPFALDVLECFPDPFGAGAETGWLRFCGITFEPR
jgi:hypothetical protein